MSTAMEGHSQAENWKNPDRPSISPLLLTPRETAKALRISERTLYTLTKAGKIRAVRIGSQGKRYRVQDLQEFVQAAQPFVAVGEG
ncbi:MAG: helix-turn-helix domain-containing protein [Planctomycetes bacterium]|nr:helix-turn-helix domain-containing protein [Planctomycetota bacterium]